MMWYAPTITQPLRASEDDELERRATQVSALLVVPCNVDVEHKRSIASTEIPSTPLGVELRIHRTLYAHAHVTISLTFATVKSLAHLI